MARQPKTANGAQGTVAQPGKAQALAEVGVRTADQFAKVMSALMSDVLSGRVMPLIANATCNAGGKLLKAVELQHKYGNQKAGAKHLQLA